MQSSRTDSARAADVWSHVNTAFGRCTHKCIDGFTSLNNHFQTVAISSDHESAASFVVPSSSIKNDPFKFSEISVSWMYFHLQHLDAKKSTGPDGLSARFLRSISSEIDVPIAKLFNESLKAGVFPSVIKSPPGLRFFSAFNRVLGTCL